MTDEVHAVTPELLLRFSCQACAKTLIVPLSKLEAAHQPCPGCQVSLDVPPIDQRVMGFSAVRTAVNAVCPGCDAALSGYADQLARAKKCPKCRRPLKLAMTIDDEPPLAIVISEPRAERKAKPRRAQPAASRNGNGQPRIDARGRTAATAVEPVPQLIEPEPALPEPVPSQPRQPEAVVYQEVQSREERGGASSSPSWLAWRGTYWTFQIVIPLILLVSALEMTSPPLFVLAILFALPRVAHMTTQLIAPFWMRFFSCPGCHEAYEAVSRWKCSCGFVDHRDRHVLRFRCPLCGGRLGRTNCMRCESTIFLR